MKIDDFSEFLCLNVNFWWFIDEIGNILCKSWYECVKIRVKINSRWRGENSPENSPKNSPSGFDVNFYVLMWIYEGLLMKSVIIGSKVGVNVDLWGKIDEISE